MKLQKDRILWLAHSQHSRETAVVYGRILLVVIEDGRLVVVERGRRIVVRGRRIGRCHERRSNLKKVLMRRHLQQSSPRRKLQQRLCLDSRHGQGAAWMNETMMSITAACSPILFASFMFSIYTPYGDLPC